jgi:hypothetical protein
MRQIVILIGLVFFFFAVNQSNEKNKLKRKWIEITRVIVPFIKSIEK